MMPIRSILAGVGAYLPERIVTNDDLARTARHLGRLDQRAHRHPPAPYRRAARDLRLHGHARRRGPRCADAGAAPRRRGRHHPGHQHARPGVPGDRAARAGRARRDARLRLRRRGRLRRLHLRPVGRRRHDPRRPGARRPGDRQRGLLAHPQLAGPRHLRAVRRRRGRGVPARRQRRAASSIAASCPPICTPRARSATSSMSMARSAGPTGPATW